MAASAPVAKPQLERSRFGASDRERIDGVDERTRAPYRAVHSRAHRAGISCRKTHLAFVMDMHDVPGSWDTPEALLEARLRESDEEAYRQFLRDREEA